MTTALRALEWAKGKHGYKYSQAKRWEEQYFDCSSLVYRAYKAAGVPLVHKDSGAAVSTSTAEVYAHGFELLYPGGYGEIGRRLPSDKGLLFALGVQPGDLVFYNHKGSDRLNRITHVAFYAGNLRILHARNPLLGVRYDAYSYLAGGVCAVLRYAEGGDNAVGTGSAEATFVYRQLRLLRPMMRGEDVRWLQAGLAAAGFDAGQPDGIFGSRTDRAVRAFQRARGLAADGIAGAKTIAALGGNYRV